MNTRWRFVVGLGDDMIGYIFPRTNAVGVPTWPISIRPTSTASAAATPTTARRPQPAPATWWPTSWRRSCRPGTSQVVTGRYLWRDGTLHRSPIGDGRPGLHRSRPTPSCRRPAAAPRAVAVGSVTGCASTAANLRWMDATGQPQARPDTQTRGVIDRFGRRYWLDVFADVP